MCTFILIIITTTVSKPRQSPSSWAPAGPSSAHSSALLSSVSSLTPGSPTFSFQLSTLGGGHAPFWNSGPLQPPSQQQTFDRIPRVCRVCFLALLACPMDASGTRSMRDGMGMGIGGGGVRSSGAEDIRMRRAGTVGVHDELRCAQTICGTR